uniref:Uncharacterized protein n=1 Tax=Romanomermis culicivorax TaxID=13658 RepID=A0A915I8J5_ROMCU
MTLLHSFRNDGCSGRRFGERNLTRDHETDFGRLEPRRRDWPATIGWVFDRESKSRNVSRQAKPARVEGAAGWNLWRGKFCTRKGRKRISSKLIIGDFRRISITLAVVESSTPSRVKNSSNISSSSAPAADKATLASNCSSAAATAVVVVISSSFFDNLVASSVTSSFFISLSSLSSSEEGGAGDDGADDDEVLLKASPKISSSSGKCHEIN